MISRVFITTNDGNPIADYVLIPSQKYEAPKLLLFKNCISEIGDGWVVRVKSGDVNLCAIIKKVDGYTETVLHALARVKDVLERRFGSPLKSSKLRPAFVMLYELLDEIFRGGAIFGYDDAQLEALVPSTDALSNVKRMMKTEPITDFVPPYRNTSVSGHMKPRVSLKVYERLICSLPINGQQPMRLDVEGFIHLDCFLNGYPTINIPIINFPRSARCFFHGTVNRQLFHAEHHLECHPPEGSTDLLRYHASLDTGFKRMPITIQVERSHTGNTEYICIQLYCVTNPSDNSLKPAIIIDLRPKLTASSNFFTEHSTQGSLEFDSSRVIWKVGEIGVNRTATLNFSLPMFSKTEGSILQSANLQFEIVGKTVTGLVVGTPKITPPVLSTQAAVRYTVSSENNFIQLY